MTFVNGVIFASAAALGVVLGIVLLLRWFLTLDASLDQTVIRSGLPAQALGRDAAVFMALAGLAGWAFLGELLRKRWRLPADFLLAVALSAVLILFLAEAETRWADLAVLAAVSASIPAAWMVVRYTSLATRFMRWLDG